jgi:hypothetical protein
MSPLFDVDPGTGEILTQRESQCPHCAEEIQQRLVVQVDLQNAQSKLQDAWREIARLKTELANQQLEAPNIKAAKAIFRYWVARLEKNPKTTKFGEKRRKVVLAMLAHYEPYYICRAIDGLAVSVYTSPAGKRFDDLELVCRDEVQLENRYELAERVGAPTFWGPAWEREFGSEIESTC